MHGFTDLVKIYETQKTFFTTYGNTNWQNYILSDVKVSEKHTQR